MRDLRLLDKARVIDPKLLAFSKGWPGDYSCGMFVFASPTDGKALRCIAAAGEDWDHVSVSRGDRIPDWTEMEAVARLFFKPDEYAMQLHVPKNDHINFHPFCLHWWRPQNVPIPLPPSDLVWLEKMGR